MSDDDTKNVLGQITTHLEYIREDLTHVKELVGRHDDDIRAAKTHIKVIKWLGGAATALLSYLGLN